MKHSTSRRPSTRSMSFLIECNCDFKTLQKLEKFLNCLDYSNLHHQTKLSETKLKTFVHSVSGRKTSFFPVLLKILFNLMPIFAKKCVLVLKHLTMKNRNRHECWGICLMQSAKAVFNIFACCLRLKTLIIYRQLLSACVWKLKQTNSSLYYLFFD